MDHWQAFTFLWVCQNVYRHCVSKVRHTKQYICLVDFVAEMFLQLTVCARAAFAWRLHLHKVKSASVKAAQPL